MLYSFKNSETNKNNGQVMLQCSKLMHKRNLITLSTETPGKGKVLRLDGNTFCVDRCQVSVFEKGHKVSLGGLLKGHDSRGLEAEVGLIEHY